MPKRLSKGTLRLLAAFMMIGARAFAEPATSASVIGEFDKPGLGYLSGYLIHDPKNPAADYLASTGFPGPSPQDSARVKKLDEARYPDGRKLCASARNALAARDAVVKSATASHAFDVVQQVDACAVAQLQSKPDVQKRLALAKAQMDIAQTEPASLGNCNNCAIR